MGDQLAALVDIARSDVDPPRARISRSTGPTDHSHEPAAPPALATTGGGAGVRAGASVAERGAREGVPAV